jgi:signal transduction histidine kinase
MSFFTIENIFVSIFSFLQAFIIFRHQKSKAHLIWSLFNLIVATWAFFFACVGFATNEESALYYWKLSFIPVPFIAVVYYHFIILYCNLSRPIVLKLCYVYAFTFSGISGLTNLIFNNAPLLFHSIYYNKANNWFTALFFFWGIIVYMSFYEFNLFLKRSTGLQKTQSTYMYWSMLLGFAGGTSSILPDYGIMLYPFLQLSIIFYILITTYAIFRYDVVPLSNVIKRGLVYSFLITLVTILYFVGVFAIQHLIRPFFHHQNSWSSYALLVIITIISTPLKNKIQLWVDKYALKSSPVDLAAQNENLRIEVAQTEKFKTLASLASQIVHEIKNPLSVMSMYVEKLKEKKDVPGFIEEAQEILIGEINRINTFSQELLAYSKPSEPKIVSMNPNYTINRVHHLVQTRCENSKIEIVIDQKTEKTIKGDPDQLYQAVLNLVLNAVDAMGKGGRLTISTEIIVKSFPLNIGGKMAEKSYYCIRIADTGCGISSKDLPMIFEPFFTRKENGTGLGLPITQNFIEKQGGRIEVSSKLNVGTNFDILLNLI